MRSAVQTETDHARCGGVDHARCKVVINESPDLRHLLMSSVVRGTVTSLIVNKDRMRLTLQSWKDQFSDAMTVFGSTDEETGEALPPSCADYVVHYISLPWKIAFAVIPPAEWIDGWPCFAVSLGLTGVVTVIIGDMAG